MILMLPLNLVGVRHGQSLLNWVLSQYRQGKRVAECLIGLPGCSVPLTPKGCWQATSVAPFLAGLPFEFDAGYCSPFLRTIQTASLMMPDASPNFWRFFDQIRERDWGNWECIPSLEENLAREAELAKAKSDLRMFWGPPGGETGHHAELRTRGVIGSIDRSKAENVIFSCHGELIEFLLRMFNDWGTLHDWQENKERWGYLLDPVNCQVVWLTRVDPESSEVADYYRWVKSAVPWDSDHPNNRDWAVMERKRYSGADLRLIVEQSLEGFPSIEECMADQP